MMSWFDDSNKGLEVVAVAACVWREHLARVCVVRARRGVWCGVVACCVVCGVVACCVVCDFSWRWEAAGEQQEGVV